MYQSLGIIALEHKTDEAEMLFRAIKVTGYGVKPFLINDEENLASCMEEKAPNLILYRLNGNKNTISIDEVTKLLELSGLHTPIIAIADETIEFEISRCMLDGATDVVQIENIEHFKLVVKRCLASDDTTKALLALKNKLVESQERCNTLMSSSKDAIAYIHEGMHIHFNDAYLELFGITNKSDLEALSMIDLVTAEEQDNLKSFLQSHSKDPEANTQFITMIMAANKVILRQTLEFCPAQIDGESCTQVVIRAEAAPLQTGELTNTAQTEFLVTHDISSGFYNRTSLLEELEDTVKNIDSADKKRAFVLCKIDKYDTLQSNLGVLKADKFYGKIGKILSKAAVDSINIARFDTSVYGFILSSSNEDQLKEIIGSMRISVKGHVLDIDGKSASCTLSSGAAIIYDNSVDSSEIVSRATRSLAKAERKGDTLEVYIPDENEKSQKQIDEEWGEELKKALKEDRLRLAFQPIASLLNDGKKRFTIFIRMLDVHGKLLDAAEFMPSIERISLAVGLDRYVLLKSLKLLAKENNENMIFFVKLTAETLQNPETFKWYREQILSHNIKPSQIVFELKATTINNYIKAAKEFYSIMKPVGCKMVVEGLSTGSDPFQLFKHIEAEYIKIGMEYVKDINNSDENKEIIRNISKEAQNRKQQLIVQHIENAQQLTTLWGLSVHYVQGNFLQPPSETMNYDFESIG